MRTLWTTLLLVGSWLCACVTPADVEGELATWQGVDADVLAATWGAPYGTYTKKDGSRILSYSSAKVVTIGGHGFERAQSRSCQVDFAVNTTNVIESATFRGALDHCSEMIRPYNGGAKVEAPAEPATQP